jgi:hypothetical protein
MPRHQAQQDRNAALDEIAEKLVDSLVYDLTDEEQDDSLATSTGNLADSDPGAIDLIGALYAIDSPMDVAAWF